jgi:hypothetical protein
MAMRLVLALIIILSAVPALAVDESIEIFSDEALTQKTLADTQPRLVDIYLVHTTYGSTGCSLRIAASAGFTGVWVSESSSWLTLGTTQTGFDFTYAMCLAGSATIVKVTYQLFGTSAACSSLRVAAHPRVVFGGDNPICDHCFGEYPLPGGTLPVNCTVGTESTTWGKVKALYRN